VELLTCIRVVRNSAELFRDRKQSTRYASHSAGDWSVCLSARRSNAARRDVLDLPTKVPGSAVETVRHRTACVVWPCRRQLVS